MLSKYFLTKWMKNWHLEGPTQAGTLCSESTGSPFPREDEGPTLHSAVGCGRAVCHLPLSTSHTVTSRTYLTHLGFPSVLSMRVHWKLPYQRKKEAWLSGCKQDERGTLPVGTESGHTGFASWVTVFHRAPVWTQIHGLWPAARGTGVAGVMHGPCTVCPLFLHPWSPPNF